MNYAYGKITKEILMTVLKNKKEKKDIKIACTDFKYTYFYSFQNP